jgi:hypothetical protein
VFSELIESLRCVREHAPAQLVAVAEQVIDRHIRRGSLGCPTCLADYPVADGVADFRLGSEGPALPPPKGRVEEELAIRAGALLGLAEPGGLVLLAGAWTQCAPELVALLEPVKVLAIDAAPGMAEGVGLSLARTAGVIPLRAASARGIALDAAHATPGYLESAAAAVAPNGRLVAPISVAVPTGFTELARDAREWVAERITAPTVVPLSRAPRKAPQSPPAEA